MASFMKEFEHLEIQLEDIKLATDNFDDTKVIGTGGFGKVYKGEISHYKGRSMAAFKRLDRIHGQGDPEFWKEIMMLSRYTHQNLISLLGFCNESGEKILVYEHASNGSLDRHLGSTALTWTQRIKICLDAARGLSYLHDHKGTQQRVLHRDIKSSNILLDENWNAKVSDMGLSKIGPANQHYTSLFTNVVGTPGYCDPLYMETYSLTKESDVYSFGVVLFEVLCGRLCYKYCDGQLSVLVHAWKKSYKENKLNELVVQDLMQQMRPRSLETFSDIAFQCLHKSREQRPTMHLVVEKLVATLEFQEHHDMKLRPMPLLVGNHLIAPEFQEHEDIPLLKDAVTPLVYLNRVNDELNADPLNWKLFNGRNTELTNVKQQKYEGIGNQQLSSVEQSFGMLDLSLKPSSSSNDVQGQSNNFSAHERVPWWWARPRDDVVNQSLNSSNDVVNQSGVWLGSQTPHRQRYTKVYKSGSVARSIDLTNYKGYEELRHDLALIFGIEGQLESADWKLVYVDHDNDVLLLGDDRWEEFVNYVRAIKILPESEIKQMSLENRQQE